MADSFDTETPEGRVRQLETILGASGMTQEQVDMYLNAQVMGHDATAREVVSDSYEGLQTILGIFEITRRNKPDIIGFDI